MSKKVYLGTVINLLIFGIGLFVGGGSVLAFMMLVYLLPAVCNTILMAKENQLSQIVMPLITTVIYGVFSYIFMQQAGFMSFVTTNSKELGEFSVQVNNNLLGFGQIIFVFLINFGAIYITSKLTRRDVYVTSK